MMPSNPIAQQNLTTRYTSPSRLPQMLASPQLRPQSTEDQYELAESEDKLVT